MAIDKGYGSGKPRSAANSRARQRVAAKRYSKGKKNPEFNLVSKAGEVADFIVSGPKETRGKYAELGVSGAKLASVAKALFKAGNNSQAVAVADRALVKNMGRELGQSKYFARQRPIGNWTKAGDTIENLRTVRGGTRSVFPRGTRSESLPGRIIAKQNSIDIGMSKDLLIPGRAKRVIKAVGTVNKKGVASLNKKPSPSGLSPRNFPKRGR